MKNFKRLVSVLLVIFFINSSVIDAVIADVKTNNYTVNHHFVFYNHFPDGYHLTQYSDSTSKVMTVLSYPNSITIGGTSGNQVNLERTYNHNSNHWRAYSTIPYWQAANVYNSINNTNKTVLTLYSTSGQVNGFWGNVISPLPLAVGPDLEVVLSGSSVHYTRPAFSVSGLSPNTVYHLGGHFSFHLWGTAQSRVSNSGDSVLANTSEDSGAGLSINTTFIERVIDGGTFRLMPVYTSAASPILSASNVKDVSAVINWNGNGNPSGTSYTLQRRVPGQSWVNRYTGTLLTFSDTGLNNESTYHYRVIVNHIAGSNMNSTSWQNGLEYISLTTTADPAVAAAQEAASRAAAAEEAAKQTLQYAQDAKSAAEQAKQSADNALAELNNETYGLSSLKTRIDKLSTPIIIKATTNNGATAISGSNISPPIVINSAGATHFQLSLDGVNWGDAFPVEGSGNISLGQGLNSIKVRAFNSDIAETNRSYAYSQLILFRI